MKKMFVKICLTMVVLALSITFMRGQTTIDLSVESCDFPKAVTAGSSIELKTTFKNNGNEVINSFIYSWVINNTEVKKSSVISDANIAVGETKTIAHKFFVEVPQVNCVLDFQIYIANVNAGKDENLLNDSLSMTVDVTGGYNKRLAVIDHFTSMHCGPCAITGPALEELLQGNNNMDKVAYLNIHTGLFAGKETLHNPAAANRDQLYKPTSFPQVYVGGDFRGMPNKITQAHINQEHYMPSYVNSNCVYRTEGEVIKVGGTVENLMDFSSDIRIFFAVVESVEFDTPPGTNGEKHFTNVLRKFIPEDNGLILGDIVKGGKSSFLEQWEMMKGIDISKMTVYMFLQDVNTKKYFAAEKLKEGEITTGSECLQEINDVVKVVAFGGKVKVNSLTDEEFTVQIININGQLIDEKIGADCEFDISKKGVYIIRVIGNKVNHARKVIIN